MAIFTLVENTPVILETAQDHCEINRVPPHIFNWLSELCDDPDSGWIRMSRHRGQTRITVRGYAGILQAPDGTFLEVLPKTANNGDPNDVEFARKLLLKMLSRLRKTPDKIVPPAHLAGGQAPLIEVFIGCFLQSVNNVVKKGIRSDYTTKSDDITALKGKLIFGQHIRRNLFRPQLFYTEHDDFSPNRPENRLIRSALEYVRKASTDIRHQRLTRELIFAFEDIPSSISIDHDISKIRNDRGMEHYTAAIAWSKLLLCGHAPIPKKGKLEVPGMMFSMHQLFENYLRHHLRTSLIENNNIFHLHQSRKLKILVKKENEKKFRMKPDFIIKRHNEISAVLDAKWKNLERSWQVGNTLKAISQSDIYQIYTYGSSHIRGNNGRLLALVYPRTEEGLPYSVGPFQTNNEANNVQFKVWILAFCLNCDRFAAQGHDCANNGQDPNHLELHNLIQETLNDE